VDCFPGHVELWAEVMLQQYSPTILSC